MLPTVEQSEVFKNEYKMFSEKIATISSDQVREELNGLLIKLLREVRSIDEQHQSMLLSRQLPSTVDDTRNAISEIRKTLFSRLADVKTAESDQA